MVSKKRKSRIAKKKEQIRNNIWPKLNESLLWKREVSAGWLSVPRAMPLILRIADLLAPKGKPVSSTYFELWCRTYDDSFVIVSNPREMAYFSGFSGERAVSTWSSRIRILCELGFIRVEGSGVTPINYILLINPYLVIKAQHAEKNVSDPVYNSLQQRLIEIGADDLD